MASNFFVRAVDDALNLGKQIAVRTKGSVHLHRVVTEHPQDITGVYFVTTGLLTVSATHASDGGHFTIINPVGSGITIGLRRVAYQGAPVDVTAAPTALLEVERFTYTGTPSGAVRSIGKANPTHPSAGGSVRTALTGMSLTMSGAPHRGFLIPAVPSGNNTTGSSNELVWTPQDSEGESEIPEGGGFLFRQAIGNGGDTRVFLFNVSWVEFTPET